MSKMASALLVALALGFAGCANGEEASKIDPPMSEGHAVFNRWCSGCHSAGDRPGTRALKIKYLDSDPRISPVLEERTDLSGDMIAHVVRNGISFMPPFRKTEVSDRELAALIGYLSHP